MSPFPWVFERHMVMVCIHPERLPPRANKKIHSRNAGPFKGLKLSSNVGISLTFNVIGISLTFNVANLTLWNYHQILVLVSPSMSQILHSTMGMTIMQTLKNKPLPYQLLLHSQTKSLMFSMIRLFLLIKEDSKSSLSVGRTADLRCYMDCCYWLPVPESKSLGILSSY